MTRLRSHRLLPAACLAIAIAALPAMAADTTTLGEANGIAVDELALLAGGAESPLLGIAIDDLQLTQSTTVAAMNGNLLNNFVTGAAFNNVMANVEGIGNTMVVNTGVLTMSNSVNLNLILNMSR